MNLLLQSETQIAIGYVRCSTDKQEREGYSLDQQVKEIEQYCHDYGLYLTAIFREIESAKTAEGRPVFQAARQHLEANESDVMVFTNWDRFARNILDHETIRQDLRKRGKQLIATQQRFLSAGDEDDYELEAALSHAAVDNEKERKKIRARLVRGLKQKVSQGGWHGSKPPYEYDIVQGEPVLNFARWQVIKKIIRLRKWAKMTYHGIADYLNETGVPGYSARTTLKRRIRKSLRRSDGTWYYRSVVVICKHWEAGIRQQWKEHYEAKRQEREGTSKRAFPTALQAQKDLMPVQQEVHEWLSEQAKATGKSQLDFLKSLYRQSNHHPDNTSSGVQ